VALISDRSDPTVSRSSETREDTLGRRAIVEVELTLKPWLGAYGRRIV